jgi:hypothetical protein
MSVNSPDGVRAAEAEWETPYSSPELEWESHESAYSNPETEWETHESHFSNPYSMPEAVHYSTPEMEDEWEAHENHYSNPYSNPEDEWETQYSAPEAVQYSTPESEWESHESHFSNPYSAPEMEDEWESEHHYSNPEGEYEWEAHARRPAPQAARPAAHSRPAARPASHRPPAGRAGSHAPSGHRPVRPIPLTSRVSTHTVRRLIPAAQRAANGVAHHVVGRAATGIGPSLPGGIPAQRRYGRRRFYGQGPRFGPRPGYASPVGRADSAGTFGLTPAGGTVAAYGPRSSGRTRTRRSQTVAGLFRQLSRIFGEAETEVTEMEAELFGVNEFEGELSAHETAHEAALTEVLAAEAAHTESESEAEALLGAALPITITIMGGRRPLRRVQPTLARANARLVRSIRASGPSGPQLLRAVPAIQRRTIASLKVAQRAGKPITPTMVARVMAGQAARVLSTPTIFGPAVTRNTAVRQSTVAPAGRRIRPLH